MKKILAKDVPYFYHGSSYIQPRGSLVTLKPGAQHSGVVDRFEENETNEYLYVTDNEKEAGVHAVMGFFQRRTSSSHFTYDGRRITIETSYEGRVVDRNILKTGKIVIYKIQDVRVDENGYYTNFEKVQSDINKDFQAKTKDPVPFTYTRVFLECSIEKFLSLYKLSIFITNKQNKK